MSREATCHNLLRRSALLSDEVMSGRTRDIVSSLYFPHDRQPQPSQTILLKDGRLLSGFTRFVARLNLNIPPSAVPQECSATSASSSSHGVSSSRDNPQQHFPPLEEIISSQSGAIRKAGTALKPQPHWKELLAVYVAWLCRNSKGSFPSSNWSSLSANAGRGSEGIDGQICSDLPKRYELVDPLVLVTLISRWLTRILKNNSLAPDGTYPVSRFHSTSVPHISVRDYLERLTERAGLSQPVLLSILVYFEKLHYARGGPGVSSLTVHRLLLSCVTVASKCVSDIFYSNRIYARIGGVHTEELVILEVELLKCLEWNAIPQPEELAESYIGLTEASSDHSQESF